MHNERGPAVICSSLNSLSIRNLFSRVTVASVIAGREDFRPRDVTHRMRDGVGEAAGQSLR